MILSTGDIALAKGPNDVPDDGKDNGEPGDSDLDVLVTGLQTRDAAVLEFDIISATAGNFEIEFIFASEEYSEWIGDFNDIMAIFVDGHNVALVPGTALPVAVNTIHNGNDAGTIPPSHSQFFVNNEPPTINIQYDGLTTLLTTEAVPIEANIVYRVKIAIADARDWILDSAVFIAAELPLPCD